MATGTKRARGLFSISVNKSILGMKVMNTEREDLGKIEDLVIDTRDSRVAYAILSFGGLLGMGDKHFVIPWQALTIDLSQRVALLQIDKDRLENAPGFDKDSWPDLDDAAWATSIHSHYGYRPHSEDEGSPSDPNKPLP